MSIPKIKRLLKMRLISSLLSGVFTGLAIIFSIGNPLTDWPWIESILTAAACIMLATASMIWFVYLNKMLASSGL